MSVGELKDFVQQWNCSWRFEFVSSSLFYLIPLASSQTWNPLSTQRQKVGCPYPGNTTLGVQATLGGPFKPGWGTDGNIRKAWRWTRKCCSQTLLKEGRVHRQALQLPQILQHHHASRRLYLCLWNSRCRYQLLQYLVHARTLFLRLAEHNGAVPCV